jgi:hypothetical protein
VNDGMEMLAPRARSTGIVVRELTDETLVYDMPRQQAHALDRLAGLVWGYCDGETPVVQMADRLEVDLGQRVSTDLIWQTIAQLGEKNLLEEEAQTKPQAMTRRDMMKKVGLVASAVAITSIVVPATAAHAACSGNGSCGQSCTAPFGGSTGNGSCNANEANLCDLENPDPSHPSCPGTCCMDNASVTYTTSTCTSPGSGLPCCCHGKTCQPKGNNGGFVCQP